MFTTTSDDGDAATMTLGGVVGYQGMHGKTQMPKPSKGTLEKPFFMLKLSRDRTAAFPSIMIGHAQLALIRA
ncbi:hypothetical protein SADUNF_Sadunf02G0011900 [Salix dunnii]|uniref:Uncharacterized protein n=1 Tax=Salix dunnii TaxID=1413687 RepID=A0A835TEV6_9ROSI|nr:hypothetical protein SADUNF_Sadunf02G0011900 [Salix dunnii]